MAACPELKRLRGDRVEDDMSSTETDAGVSKPADVVKAPKAAGERGSGTSQ